MVLLEHPTVVTCWEVLETESNICLVVEYCAGGHIEDYISPTRSGLPSAPLFCLLASACHATPVPRAPEGSRACCWAPPTASPT